MTYLPPTYCDDADNEERDDLLSDNRQAQTMEQEQEEMFMQRLGYPVKD